MKNAVVNISFKLLVLTGLALDMHPIQAANPNVTARGNDIVECSSSVYQANQVSSATRQVSALQERLCLRFDDVVSTLTQSSFAQTCVMEERCRSQQNYDMKEAQEILANFAIKRKLEEELPRSMIYSAVKNFLEQENAFPSSAKENGKIYHKCATDEYSINGAIDWAKKNNYEVNCNKHSFERSGSEYYRGCGKNKKCFGELDNVLGENRLVLGKENKANSIEEFIQNNTKNIENHYKKVSDDYIDQIRIAMQSNRNLDEVLKEFRHSSPILMAMYMDGKDRATNNIKRDLEPVVLAQKLALKNADLKNPEAFKATFKKFQIAVGQGMFSTCKNGNFFPYNPAAICNYAGMIANGRLDRLSVDKYSNDELVKLFNDVANELQDRNDSNFKLNSIGLICRVKKVNDNYNNPSANRVGNGKIPQSLGGGGTNKSSSEADLRDPWVFADNAAIDSGENNALIDQEKARFASGSDTADKIEESAIIQANNQNLKGQNIVDKSAFINTFAPIDNYSGIANDYVNKSYINRAEKLKEEKSSASSDSSLDKQYSDIEAKIAEAEARLKELQSGLGEVGKNAANKGQPIVSNGVSKEKTQTSSEIEELLKEIKELKAQNNEIKEKLVAKEVSDKSSNKVSDKNSISSSNASNLAFASGSKNDNRFDSKIAEIKPTQSYSASQAAARIPASLGAAKLGGQASQGAILSAVDRSSDAVTPARAVTRVDSFNSESARKAITSRINEINKNTKEIEQNKATIEVDGQLKEVISFEVLDEKGHKKLVVVELKDGKVVLDKDGNPVYVSQEVDDESIVISKKDKDDKNSKKLQSEAEVKRADELKVQKGRSAERVKLNDLTRSAVKKDN